MRYCGLAWDPLVIHDLAILLFAGAERCSRPSEGFLKIHCERVCATEHAPRGRNQFLERRHGFAEIAKRGACVHMRCFRVIRPHPERELMIFARSQVAAAPNDSRGATSPAARTRPRRQLSTTCDAREPRSTPAKSNNPKYAIDAQINIKQELSHGSERGRRPFILSAFDPDASAGSHGS